MRSVIGKGRNSLFVAFLGLCLFLLGMERPVAPLKDPIFCGYLRLQESFSLILGNDTTPGSSGVNLFRAAMAHWRRWRATMRRDVASSTSVLSAADPAVVLRQFSETRSFIPEDLYFYFRGPDDFAVLLTGTIDPACWRDLFPSDHVLARDKGFAVLFNSPGNGHQMALHVRDGVVFLSPAEFEGNLVDSLREGVDGLNERFKTFRAMVQRGPMLAIEADLQEMSGQLTKYENPNFEIHDPLTSVRTFRLMVDRQFVKAQFHVPDDSARADIADWSEKTVQGIQANFASATAESTAPAIGAGEESFKSLIAGLKVETKSQSVFINAPGLGESELQAGVTALALFSSIAESSFERFKIQFPPPAASGAARPNAAMQPAAATAASERLTGAAPIVGAQVAVTSQ